MKSFPEQGGILAPPLFIEEVDAKQTEEFNLKSKIAKSKMVSRLSIAS